MLVPRGLGSNIQPSSLPPGTQTSVQVSLGFTLAEIEARHRAAAIAIGDRVSHEMHAFAQTLAPCPAGWPACDAAPSLLPPGAFQFFGFPFHIAELKDGRFDRSFALDNDQRTILEWAVIQRSGEVIANRIGSALVANDPRAAAFSIASVQDVLNLVPDARLSVPNFFSPPIAPTHDELTGSDGFRTWTDRGGYLISSDVATGRIQFYNGVSLSTCTSVFCASCAGAQPACIRTYIGKNGLVTPQTQDDVTENGTWAPYVAFGPGSVRLVLLFEDPAWYQRMASAVSQAFEAIANALCAVAPIAQSQLQTLTQDKCLDKAGKPCVKGTVNCKCVSPSGTTQASIGITDFVMNKWCSAWGQEQQGPLPLPPPTGPIMTPTTMPWGWIIAGGLLAGAIMFNRKRP